MTILCYHSVQPDLIAPIAMHPETFKAHCAWISANRSVLPLAEGARLLDTSGRLPRGVTCLTFDDGFSSLYDHVLPVLTRYRFPATVFLVAQTLIEKGHPVDWVDRPAQHNLTTLTADEVLEMQSAGVDFQSHSQAHLDLTHLSYDDCVRDLRESREFLESLLGKPVPLLAYPRGRHNDTVRAAVAAAGYTHAFSLPEGPEPVGRYAVPRVGLFRGNSVRTLQIKSARSYLPMRTSRAFDSVQRLRRTVFRRRGPAT